MINIIEIKAKSSQSDEIRGKLQNKKAIFKGIDHQIDTYFNCPNGRLKLRQGNIETTLIHYNRANQSGPKNSQVSLHKPKSDDSNLNTVLSNAYGIKVIVDKKREIYFIENVKFHIDTVQGLGDFVEIEAIDEKGEFTLEQLQSQCNFYMKFLNIQDKDLIEVSYSDMILELKD